MAFINLTDANIVDASFWASLDINSDSTIDVSGISDTIQVIITANSITFTNTVTGIVTTYSDGDLFAGSFSNFVAFTGNDANNIVGGSVGLNSSGYTGGAGDDTFTDDGNLGGQIFGGSGDDTITGGIGNNQIYGGDDDDIIFGVAGENVLEGGDGNDTLFAGDGSGNLDGGAGDDQLFASDTTTFVEGGTGNDTLTLTAGSTFAPFSSTGGVVTLPDGVSTFTYLNVENIVIACFTKGTRIRTAKGNVSIEDLSVGDFVNTADNGQQPIKWIGKRRVAGVGHLAPVVFQKHAIGNKRELRVSPEHRILLRDWQAEYLFGEREVLIAAKHLVNADTIYSAECDEVTYYHILFDQHEIVFAEGAKTESFYPTQSHIETMEIAARAELYELFPELMDKECGAILPSARRFVQGYEASLLN